LPLGWKAYRIVGVVKFEKVLIDYTKGISRSSDIGATLPATDVALAAASIPIRLGEIGHIELGEKPTRSYGLETKDKTSDREIIATEYCVIRTNLDGFSWHPIYRDSIRETQGRLTSMAAKIEV